jgi:hypothetical protein
MSQDASPGIANGLTTLHENSQNRPGLESWDILSRPFGTQLVSRVLTQGLKPGYPSNNERVSAACSL